MTPKQKVMRRYPKAFSEENGNHVQIVTPLPYGRVEVLGIVSDRSLASKREAWAQAAQNMKGRGRG